MTTFTDENPQFTLYSHTMGPNGWKVAEVLCELGLTYRTVLKDFGNGPNGMKTPDYEAINPNGRIPALVDHAHNDYTLWESGAIILYLMRRYDTEFRLWSPDLEDQSRIETWLFFQASGMGPYIGQGVWFRHFHSEKIESAVVRYREETRRVLGVLEKQLARNGSGGWLVLGRITLADVSFLHWLLHCSRIQIYVENEFPIVWGWMHRMLDRPAIKKGMEGTHVPGWPGLEPEAA